MWDLLDTPGVRLLVGYLCVLAVMSPLTFLVYAWDKHRARKKAWRVSEKTLHTLELLGGWPGGIAARQKLRHKSAKRGFRAVSWAIVGLHAVAVAWMTWLLTQGA
ncbi:MAG: DUF1294 domain-containing protein [Planctomycetota bacterium]